MLNCVLMLAACLAAQGSIEPAHAQNAVFNQVLGAGFDAGGERVKLPAPRLKDGMDAAAQRAALRETAGSDAALENFLRNSITAPYIIKVHDRKQPGLTVREADLWFVVYAELKEIDFAREAGRSDRKEVEAANMWFQTRLLKPDDIRSAGVEQAAAATGENTWYSHVHARLLDRIDFEVTNQVVATQSAESVVIATRTDPAFAKARAAANGWKPLSPAGDPNGESRLEPYSGGISYAKISRLGFAPGALLIELHVAFVEPDGWFQGAPILRSKFSVVAQDQIRALRRELARKRTKSNGG
jgi:hypothetical protein